MATRSSEQTPPARRASLVTKFVLVWSALLIGMALLCGWLIWQGGRDSLTRLWRESLRHNAAAVELKLQDAVSAVMRDAAYLAQTPTVREFVSARSGPEQERWRRLVEEGFSALLAGKPSYFQVRLIGVADEGREIVRLDHAAGKTTVAGPDRLQQKADRDYFRAALGMPEGAVYVSPINLNQEFGKVSIPHTPTLRAAIRVKHADGSVFGVIVINVDASDLLRELESLPGQAIRLTLAGGTGDYLVHADRERTFGSDLGTHWKFNGQSPSEGAELSLVHRFTLAPGVPQEVWALLAVPDGEWLSQLRQAGERAALATGTAVLCGIAIILFLARWMARRLRQVTESVAAYEAGAEISLSTPASADELGRLATAFQALSRKVQDHVAGLEQARRDAEDATRSKEEFLAVMSHEIRTPMNSVMGLIRVLERSQPPAHQEPVLRSLRIAARNLLSLLNDALDFTRLKAGALDFEQTAFSLRDFLDDLETTHRPLAMQKGLGFHVETDAALPPHLTGDPVRLLQILNNLISNALKFTDEGSVHVYVRPGADGQVRFIVEDSGVGIPEGEQDRIFAPFAQVRRADGRHFHGSGLGLSIVRELAEGQGGKLSVESEPGEGSRFTVELPLPPAAPAAAEHPVTGGVPDFSGLHILYIEDVESNRFVMSAHLDETGAALQFAETAAAAMAALASDPCDLVLLDLQLPDATGTDLARRILEAHPALPIIAVTAQTSHQSRHDCEAAGISEVVTKPLQAALLFAAIERGAQQETPSLEDYRALFAGQPDKLRQVFHSLADDFTRLAAELPAALDQPGHAALRALRHRMLPALTQLKLPRLTTRLESIEHASPAALARCLATIQQVASRINY